MHLVPACESFDTDVRYSDNSVRMGDISRALNKLTDKLEALTFEQASQHREILRQNRELDRQSSEIDRLRQLTYSLSRYSGIPGSPSAMPSRHHSPSIETESRQSSQGLALASGVTGLRLRDRIDSNHPRSHHGSQASISSSAAGAYDHSHSHLIHKSASHHAVSSRQHTTYSGGPSPASSVRGGSIPVSSLQGNVAYGGTTPVPVHQNRPSGASSYPSIPPRHVNPVSVDQSARGRAHTTSAYYPQGTSSASKTDQAPFFNLAAASGVVLPEPPVRTAISAARTNADL